jgi:hypothetical protein
MARKFLYVVAVLAVLVIAGVFALRLFPDKLTSLAFVPTAKFEAQPPLARNVYADPKMWRSRPGMAGDPARWLPTGLTEDADALGAAVFFIHPTSYLDKSRWNAPLHDPEAVQLAATFIRGLATPFNKSPDLWAPRYRQATFGAFLSDDPAALQALDLAYADITLAFEQFVSETAPGQPIVLAGHSQGAYLLRRLLKDRVAGKPLARRVAAAYAIGWPVSLDHDLPLMGLPACAAPEQSGCVVSWLSYGEPADPAMTLAAYARRPALDGKAPKGSAFLCSNPLTGRIEGEAPASSNLGTLKPNKDTTAGSLVTGLVSARCRPDGLLSIGPAPELGPYVLPGNNYHVYDIPLFWANLRADVVRRVKAWKPG